MILYQIKGGNCSGKTSLVKSILGKNFKVDNNRKIPLSISGEVVSIGDYSNKYGLDASSPTKEGIIEAIEYAINQYEPKIILLENITHGKIQKFTEELYKKVQSQKHKYIGVFLYQDIGTAIDRCVKRGNPHPNEKEFINSALAVDNCYLFCLRKKIPCIRIDTSDKTTSQIKEQVLSWRL